MTGWILIGVLILAAAALFFLRSAWEREHPVTTTYKVESEKLAPELDGMRLVFLTDLHNKEFGPDNERLLAAVRAVKPDMVLCGGDLMIARGHDTGDLRVTLNLCKQLAKEYPVYYGYGNHELRLKNMECYREQYGQFLSALRGMGVRILDDMSVTQAGRNKTLTVTGVTLPKAAYPRYKKAPLPDGFLRERAGTVREDDFRILLAHTPLYAQEYAEWGADLTLCGHYHGGTVILPFIGALMSPDYHLFPRVYRGSYETDGHTMIVSGGLGTHSVNIRFGNRPEIVVVELGCGHGPVSK